MGLFGGLIPDIGGLFGGGGGDSSLTNTGNAGAFNKQNSNTSTSATTSADNAYNQTIGNGGVGIGDGGIYDASSRVSNWITDSSNHASTNTNTDASTHWWDSSVHNQITDSSSRDYSQSWADSSSTSNSTAFSDSSSRDNSQHWTDNSQRTTTTSTDNSNRSTFSLSDASSRDLSQHWTDSSSRDLSQHFSDSSQTTITNTGTDAAQIIALNAGLLQAVNENQGDTVRLIARMGAESLATAGASATNLYETSSANATRAWGQTVDAASAILDKLMTTTRGAVADTLQAAQAVGTRSVDQAPKSTSETSGTNLNIALLAGAAVLIAAFLTKRN
jgi:membrane-bound lytic murein transglycosylase